MACYGRQKTGSCDHTQCPFSDESGYECVEVVGGMCEVGDGCVRACPYSWPAKNTKKTEKAVELMTRRAKRLYG